jgi:hypothetical protein
MLPIEYIHKHIRLFRVEISLVVVACLAALMFLWQLLGYATNLQIKHLIALL